MIWNIVWGSAVSCPWWEQGLRWVLFFLAAGGIAQGDRVLYHWVSSRNASRFWHWCVFWGTLTACLFLLLWALWMLG